VPDPLYEALQAYSSELHWFCKNCKAGANKVLSILAKLQNNVTKLEEELARAKQEWQKEWSEKLGELEGHLKGIDDRVAECETRMEKSLTGGDGSAAAESDEKVAERERSWAAVVSKQIDAKLVEVSNAVTEIKSSVETTKGDIEEDRDKMRRINNIVIYNFQESKTEEPKQWAADDKQACIDMLRTQLRIDIEPGDVKRILRLGRRATSQEESTSDTETKPRPILVEFKDRIIKNLVMQSSGRLATAVGEYKKIKIGHDMTKKERCECRDLVAEAKIKEAQEQSGEWMYRVRGTPGSLTIVKLRRTSRAGTQ
jgi:uncharacterized protein YukE